MPVYQFNNMPIKWFSIGILAHLIYWHIIYMKTTGKKTLGERINALLTRIIVLMMLI